MSELLINPCKNCGSARAGYINMPDNIFVLCCACYTRGGKYKDIDSAIIAWNNSIGIRMPPVKSNIYKLESARMVFGNSGFFTEEEVDAANNAWDSIEEVIEWLYLCEQPATQQPVEVTALKARLNKIQEYAGQYIGCRCGKDDCGPGDCWPCRMMAVCDLANPEDEELAPKRESGWQPNYDWARTGGMDIVRSALQQNNVYLQGKNGDVYRVWLDSIGLPAIELVKANAPLPTNQIEAESSEP